MLIGTSMGGGPTLLLTVPLVMALGAYGRGEAVVAMILPFGIAAAFVIPLCMLIGLPVHFALRRLDLWYLPCALLAAATVGFMAPWIVAWHFGTKIGAGFCLWGAMVGVVTAYNFARSMGRVY